MSNSVDPDETAHYEPSHLELRCLQKPVIIACDTERLKHRYGQSNSPLAPQGRFANDITENHNP